MNSRKHIMLRRKSRGRFAPYPERLEVRMVMSTFTVTTAADVVANDGVLSLREAITAANALGGPDTIHFRIGTGGAQYRPVQGN